MPTIAAIKASNGTGNASVATVQTVRAPGATTILVDTVAGINTKFMASMGTPHTFTDPVTSEVITVISQTTCVDFAGHVTGGTLVIDTIAPGYTDAGSQVGDIIVIRPTTQWGDNVAALLGVSLNDDGTLKDGSVATSNTIANSIVTESHAAVGYGLVYTGMVLPFVGRNAPTNWLMAFGQNVSRTTYANLFNVISPSIGATTITIATPAVLTLTNHNLITGEQIYLTTTGALPTGLAANTLYYVIRIDANTFNLATTRANAILGTKIATSGTQSGVHTVFYCPYGNGDGTTTFTLPDARGRVLAGSDAMGGTAAGRLNFLKAEGSFGQLGANGGEQAHTLTIAELASHAHSMPRAGANKEQGAGALNAASIDPGTTGFQGGDQSHNNVQPTLVTNYIVRI